MNIDLCLDPEPILAEQLRQVERMTWKRVKAITGGLSNPSKMPSKSYGLPALSTCPIGAKLAEISGTTCSSCYATKGRYVMPNVAKAQQNRLSLVYKALTNSQYRMEWVESMVWAISREKSKVFRWHDSGDIFSQEYLDLILEVIRRTPEIRHWLPTRELPLIRRNAEKIAKLPNLTVRVSAAKLGQQIAGLNLPTSSVDTVGNCPAPSQGGFCGDCRRCWNPDVKNVTYSKH